MLRSDVATHTCVTVKIIIFFLLLLLVCWQNGARGERWREKAGISAKERERKPFHIPQIRCVYCQKLTEGTDAATIG
jgi:hypothetical protein